MSDSDREFFDALEVVMNFLFTPLVDSIVNRVHDIIVDMENHIVDNMENQKNDD